jgi:hypothetical protein
VSAPGRYVAWTPRTALRPFPLPRPAGPVWLAWRRHRAAYLTTLALALLAALWALWAHRQLVDGVHGYAAACRRTPAACPVDQSEATAVPPRVPGSIHLLFDEAPTVLRLLPVVAGALLGAPLFAQDMENGTHRLAWTQSVGRREWAAAKLGTAAAVTVTAGVIVTLPATWWWWSAWHGHHEAGYLGYAWRITTFWDGWSFFGFTGPVGVAHLLLALMTGALAGVVVRRTLPAVAVAAAAGEGWQLALGWLRPHLLSAHVLRGKGLDSPREPLDSWHLSDGYIHADGRISHTYPCGGDPATDFHACLRTHGIVGQYSHDLVAGQLLPLQLVETALCAVAAAALAAVCLALTGRR